MLKSYLDLTNRSRNDLIREFYMFLIKLEAYNVAENKKTEESLIKLLKDDCNGWINFFDRPIPEMARQIEEENAKEAERIKKEQKRRKK